MELIKQGQRETIGEEKQDGEGDEESGSYYDEEEDEDGEAVEEDQEQTNKNRAGKGDAKNPLDGNASEVSEEGDSEEEDG